MSKLSGVLLWLLAGLEAAELEAYREYQNELGPESATERAVRHQRLAERRAGPVIMVHRGAAAFAPENSLQAYAAAMDFGADGCEVDIRRTRDGVLVLFHDEVLESLTDGFGAVRQLAYRDLCALHPRRAFGRPASATPPTFPALLDLARQRAMLLHLDIKEPGLEEEITRFLDEADAWDQVVAINAANATNLLKNPKLRLLNYKAPGLYERRLDVEPLAIKAALAKPGDMILVDDPRVAVRVLNRTPYQPVLLRRHYRLILRRGQAAAFAATNGFAPMSHVQALSRRLDPSSVEQLLKVLAADAPAGAATGTQVSDAASAARIVERAWAAQRLGELGRKSEPVVRALERLVQQPGRHPDRLYDGLDGAMAVRALGRLDSAKSVKVLLQVLKPAQRASEGLGPPPGEQSPAWANVRLQVHVMPALGQLRCRAARKFLRQYVAMDEARARAIGPPQFEDATRALLCQRLAWDQIAALLRSHNPAVRGTAIMECVSHPTDERQAALKAAAPWALKLPRQATALPLRQAPAIKRPHPPAPPSRAKS
jgi:hypothetical protein